MLELRRIKAVSSPSSREGGRGLFIAAQEYLVSHHTNDCFLSRVGQAPETVSGTQCGPRGPKNLISIPVCFFVLFNDRAADGGKNSAKNRAQHFEKFAFFSMRSSPIVRSKFLKQYVSNNMHFWSVRCLIYMVHTLMFFGPKERGSSQERGSKLGSRDGPASKFRSPGPPRGAHPDRKLCQNGNHSEF